MADKGNDPAVIWQTMIGEMEKGFNSFANQAMASPEFSKVMNQVGGVTAGAFIFALPPEDAWCAAAARRCSRLRAPASCDGSGAASP